MDTPRPPTRGKYSIRNPAANRLFYGLDALLTLCVRARPAPFPAPPRRILISDIAHLGDVLMATALLPEIKRACPDSEIGFLAGSWAQPVLQGHPLVDQVHILDHWAHNRARLSRRQKLGQYLRTRRDALRQIKAARYDVALDFYWNFPNTLPLLWQARIPVRIGYESGGFGPLATHALEFGDKRLHASQRFWDLVKTLPGVAEAPEAPVPALRPVLPTPDARDPGVAALGEALAEAGLGEKDYLVFHVGAADSFRDWPSSRWRALAGRLLAQGHPLVFTGAGDTDEARIREITEGLSGCVVNLCNRLTWPGFVAAIAGARLLVCVDTVAGHLAAATGTPCAVLTAGRWPYLWRPLGPQARVLMHPVPCAPCHRNNGCDGMECIREVTVAAVFEESQALLAAAPVT